MKLTMLNNKILKINDNKEIASESQVFTTRTIKIKLNMDRGEPCLKTLNKIKDKKYGRLFIASVMTIRC